LFVCLCRVFFRPSSIRFGACPGLVVPRIQGLCDPWGLGDPLKSCRTAMQIASPAVNHRSVAASTYLFTCCNQSHWRVKDCLFHRMPKVCLQACRALRYLCPSVSTVLNQLVKLKPTVCCADWCSCDEMATEAILKSLQAYVGLCGGANLNTPRDAIIIALCKASLPPHYALHVLAVSTDIRGVSLQFFDICKTNARLWDCCPLIQ